MCLDFIEKGECFVKLIHCADLHLDSVMTTYLSKEKAKERKAELLRTFLRMVEYARDEQVKAILIAGDLFDKKNISATARKAVKQAIQENEDITFYYLQGNHDVNFFLSEDEETPLNLKRFGTEWTSYYIEEAGRRLVITGLELLKENAGYASRSLMLDLKDFNIVMLHGQEAEQEAKDRAEVIPLDNLRNKGIDYLALGHIHTYKIESLDSRGMYCYAGCLEGRGFDECGEHGFVLLDIDMQSGRYSTEFVPFASRNLYTVPVDISGCMNTSEIEKRVRERLMQEGYGQQCLIKIVLEGEVEVDCEKDVDYLANWLKEDYYYVRIKDCSSIRVDYDAYALDESLKGEFVRVVRGQEELSEEDKGAIIQMGIQALAGEEV